MKKKVISLFLVVLLVLGGIWIYKYSQEPKLTLEVENTNISQGNKDEILIPVTMKNLPDNVFPAGSVKVQFDNNKLKFNGVKLGTMECYNNYKKGDSEKKFKIPSWSCNNEAANNDGKINLMYVDNTAGNNAYSVEGYKEGKKDIVFQLAFELKDSAVKGDKIEINILEAMFATVNGEKDKTTISTKENYGILHTKGTSVKIK